MESTSSPLTFPDILLTVGAVCGLVGHFVSGSNRVFGSALASTIAFFEELEYRDVHSTTARRLRDALIGIPERMRSAMGVTYDDVGWRPLAKMLAATTVSIVSCMVGLWLLGIPRALEPGAHPATCFLACSFLVLVFAELAFVFDGSSHLGMRALHRLSFGLSILSIMVAILVFWTYRTDFHAVLQRVEETPTAPLALASLCLAPFAIVLLFMTTFFALAIVDVSIITPVSFVYRRVRRRPKRADDEISEADYWRATYFFFGGVPSIPLTALALHLGARSDVVQVVHDRTQLIGANLVCDVVTFAITCWIIGVVSSTRSSLASLALLLVDAAVACVLAVVSLYLGLLGTPTAVSPSESAEILRSTLLDASAAGTYFWSMSTALIPTLLVLAILVLVLFGKLAVDFLNRIYERAGDRPLVFVGTVTGLTAVLLRTLVR